MIIADGQHFGFQAINQTAATLSALLQAVSSASFVTFRVFGNALALIRA